MNYVLEKCTMILLDLFHDQFDWLPGSGGVAKPAGVASCEHHCIELNEFAGISSQETRSSAIAISVFGFRYATDYSMKIRVGIRYPWIFRHPHPSKVEFTGITRPTH